MDCLQCKGDGVAVEVCECCGAQEQADVCDRCEGTGQEQGYMLPLTTKKSYLATGKTRGEVIVLGTMGKFNPNYEQLGRNFASFLVRNTPKAYVQGVLAKLEEKGIAGKL